MVAHETIFIFVPTNKQKTFSAMTNKTILSSLEVANEFVTFFGFEALTDHIMNPENRVVSYNDRGRMMMARSYANWQEIGNHVIEVTIID